MNQGGLLRRTTNGRTLVAAGVVFALGVTLLVVSETVHGVESRAWLQSVVASVGGLLIAAVSLASLWEIFSKRALLDELLGKAGLAEDIRSLGLIGLSGDPLRGPHFDKLIRKTRELDIFVCYANTWRASHEDALRELARNKKATVRLFLPSPDDTLLMAQLAGRFGAPSEKALEEKVRTAIGEFSEIFAGETKQAAFSIWVHHETPVHSYYRFDDVAVFTLYKHAGGRGSVPTFVAERGGTLYSFIQKEVDAMAEGVDEFPPQATCIHALSD